MLSADERPDRRLIDATYDHRLSEVAEELAGLDSVDGDVRSLAGRALAATRRIGEQVATERSRLVELVADVDGVAVGDAPAAAQRHELVVRVPDLVAVDLVASRLIAAGFERWERWTGGAAESFRRTADRLTLARTGEHTVVVRVAWAPHRRRRRLDRLVRPTAGDWDLVALPDRWWWGYSLVRPVRLAMERTGLRSRWESGLGPFLSTPASLLEPLLEAADVGSGDVVVDLGCGDGRLPVAAALRGASARGVETDPALARRAVERARCAGVHDRVRIDIADARRSDLGDVDVVFAFLPIDVVTALLPDLLGRMRPGARLVAHEQSRLPSSVVPSPDRSMLVVGDDAVTVAHRWDRR